MVLDEVQVHHRAEMSMQRSTAAWSSLVLHTSETVHPGSARGELERRKLQSWSAMVVRAALGQRGRRL